MIVIGLKKFCTFTAIALAASLQGSSIASAQQASAVNRGVVEVETAASTGISVRIAEDLANLVDDGATRRVVPVVGKGSLQNLIDLKYLHGIDMAIIQTDVLEYAKEQRLIPGIDTSFTYITKLYNEEFHLLARPEITNIADLTGKTVNVDALGSGTAITAARLFELLQLKPNFAHDNQEIALEKLRKGDITALAFVAGKPAPLFASLNKDDGLHFVDIPLNQTITNNYVPTRLSAGDYRFLIPQDRPVDTVAVGAVLAVADLRLVAERNRNVMTFVDTFFTGFQNLLSPGHHMKWKEVNLAAEVPGWRRYAPADQWLQRNLQVAQPPKPDELLAMFSRFVDQRRQAAGQGPMSQQQKNELFEQFRAWQSGRAK